MKSDKKFFKKSKTLPVDKFFYNVLYDKKFGYYNSKQPLGLEGDFITAPKISNLFSEMIAIWMISTWEIFGKPKNFNIVEMGPGDGALTKVLLNVFKKFPEFDKIKNIYLIETSLLLTKLQKKNISCKKVKWIKNINSIKKGPIIFFGNEFLDAIPIKQFKRNKRSLFEKYFQLQKNCDIKTIFKKASAKDVKIVNSYKSLKNLKFVEFPKEGLELMQKILNKIIALDGCILMIDYGYLKSNNQNTVQSVIRHKKNVVLKNLGKADVTSHVNFNLISEFFLKNNLKVKRTITQAEFLKNMGIENRAEILSEKMSFLQKTDLYLRLKRLLSSRYMGNLFKVILAYKSESSSYSGF